MNKMMKGGFTLIELIIVIAILAFVTVVGIHSYGNIKEIQAKKVNLANIKRVYAALSTYETLCKEQGVANFFAGFDSLVDADAAIKVRNADTEKELIPALFKLAADQELQAKLSANIGKFARPNAADDIVDQIIKAIEA